MEGGGGGASIPSFSFPMRLACALFPLKSQPRNIEPGCLHIIRHQIAVDVHGGANAGIRRFAGFTFTWPNRASPERRAGGPDDSPEGGLELARRVQHNPLNFAPTRVMSEGAGGCAESGGIRMPDESF
jgi:hypothetical protein